MHILLIQAELYIPDAHTLKEKRSIMKPLLNRLRRDYNVSVAETGLHDHWQSAELAMTAVSGMKAALERLERNLADAIESDPDAQIAAWQMEWL